MKKLLLIILTCVSLPVLAQTLPSYVPTSGLIAWYPFTGNAVDSSGNGNDGTVVGATLTTNRAGTPNSAYLFNGSSTKIATSLLPPLGNAARTISCWFKYNSIPNPCGDKGGCIAGYGGSSAGCGQARKNFSLEIDNYYGPVVPRVDGICIYNELSGDSVDNSWHFFAAVYDPADGDFRDIKLYIDGAFRTTTTVTYVGSYIMATDALSTFEIGKGHYSCQRYFDGKIDDIGIWNRALSAAELFGLYNGVASAVADSFSVYVDDYCTDQEFSIMPIHYSPSLSVRTWFGDGAVQSDVIPSSGYLQINHTYNSSGGYSVKHVLYNGPAAIDSASYIHNYHFCRTVPLKFYNDANSNCNFESTESLVYQPSTIEVDSAGTIIDTVSATSGLNYYAYGAPGNIYAFKILSTSPDLVVSCPSTGIVTETLSTALASTKNVGISCTGTPGYDLQLFTSFRAGSHHFGGTIIANNLYCTPPAAVLTMRLSPHFMSDLSFIPTPASIVGDLVTWNINSLSSVSSKPFLIYANMEGGGGGVVTTKYIINPITGDANGMDNIVIRNDNPTGSYDPNDIAVEPAGCLAIGTTQLTYTIHFENTGNDTAYNIYVLDTLSSNLDLSSLRILAASAAMNTTIRRSGELTIAKFDFPDIDLLDSSHHGMCDGMLVYTIKRKNAIEDGTVIPNRAGIYFDNNPVVVTNTVNTRIGCPTIVTETNQPADVEIFPNPVTGELFVKANIVMYSSITVTNSIGAVVMNQQVSSSQTKIKTDHLHPGLYYVTLRGAGGSIVKKIVKM